MPRGTSRGRSPTGLRPSPSIGQSGRTLLPVLEGDDQIEQEHVSLDEMYDEETKDNHYVEGIDNWEDWN